MLSAYRGLNLRLMLMSIIIVGGLVLGTITGQAWFGRSAHIDTDSGWGFPQPANMRELVSHADMIVIATVGPIAQEGMFSGYGVADKATAPTTAQFDPGAVPFVDYPLLIEKVVKADQDVNSGAPVILRMPTNRKAKITKEQLYPMSAPGDRHLFFLSRNPDGSYGVPYGPWSRFMIDGVVVSYSNGARTQPSFAHNVSLDNFLKQVHAIVVEQR